MYHVHTCQNEELVCQVEGMGTCSCQPMSVEYYPLSVEDVCWRCVEMFVQKICRRCLLEIYVEAVPPMFVGDIC